MIPVALRLIQSSTTGVISSADSFPLRPVLWISLNPA